MEDTALGGSSLISGIQIHFNFLKKTAEVAHPEKAQRDRINNELSGHIQAAIAIGEKYGLLCKMRHQPILESLPEEVRATMTADERTALRKARHARNKLILSHMRLVTNIATKEHRKASSRVQLLDLVQEGTFGLVRACEKFDPSRGFSFSTYAYRWIWQAILGALSNEERLIKLSASRLDYIRKIENGEVVPTTPQEKAELIQLSEVYQFPTSLNRILNKGGDIDRLESLVDPTTTDRARAEERAIAETRATIQGVLRRLPIRERLALQAEYCLGWFEKFENKEQAAQSSKYTRIESRIRQWIKSGEAGAWGGMAVSKAAVQDWYEDGMARAREMLEER
jgi:RNA polymerase sigma factor (sigma-70 family)